MWELVSLTWRLVLLVKKHHFQHVSGYNKVCKPVLSAKTAVSRNRHSPKLQYTAMLALIYMLCTKNKTAQCLSEVRLSQKTHSLWACPLGAGEYVRAHLGGDV